MRQSGDSVAVRTASIVSTRMTQTGTRGRGPVAGLREVCQWRQGWPWAQKLLTLGGK